MNETAVLADNDPVDECALAVARTDIAHHRAMLKIIEEWRNDAQRLRQKATEPAMRGAARGERAR
jgi:hypothetical protein